MKNKLINLIKNNIIFIIIFILLILVFTIKLPYYIDAPGGLISVKERLEIENQYPINGTLNLAYVSEAPATIPFYLYALINKDWDIVKKEEIVLDNETIKENDKRNHLLLDEANQNAIMVAFDKANIKYDINEKKVYVIFKDENSNTDLKIGDQIISVDDKLINSRLDLIDVFKEDKTYKIKVINDNKEYIRYAKKTNFDGSSLIGIMVCETKDIIPSRKVDIKFKKSESGPSGGFMMALSIYDALTKEDLTKGRKIVGTGTINELGYVGAIGGVKYKIKAAIKENADIFFVPSENYKEAKEVLDKSKDKIDLVEVKHIDDAIIYLTN